MILKRHTDYYTKNNGIRTIFVCSKCASYFSETKNTTIEGLKKPISMVITVIKVRTEGLGLNATARTYDISKNTILKWELRLASLKPTLFLYSLAHEFLQLVIEGDEIYTKVEKNVSPDESSGWTILLLERASRFIWELKCGRKKRKLFKKAIKALCKIVEKTEDISLITDGERRYGNILFELCHELLRTGKPGRPKQILPKGVKVRVKNKGAQGHKRGPKRPKYQSPFPEHPETDQNINNNDIHANHCEATFSSIRRKNSTFRRKSNTYAKKTDCLQRTLDVYWIVHNFLRVHFTTKEVPAVSLGIIDKRISFQDIFYIQKVG
jgi:hypothetical protein